MRRYWVDMDDIQKGEDGETWVHLQGKVFHHVCDVCRRREGDRFEILASDGKARLVEVVEHSKKKAVLKVLSMKDIPPLWCPYVELCMSIPRYAAMDKVVKNSVELGVYRVRPFVSDNSFIRRRESLPDSKFSRWQKIIKSSTQQCGRGQLMALDKVRTLEQLLADFSQSTNSKGLFLYEGNSQRSLKDALRQYKPSESSSIWVFIGGEGGFSDQEVKKFAEVDMESLTLGTQVLRVETACVALLSILKYEYVKENLYGNGPI